MTDERQGKPSASGMERIALCPGSWNAERGLPEQESEDAKAGTAIHERLAGIPVPLDDDQEQTFEMCQKVEGKIQELVFGGLPPHTFHREKRFWSLDEAYSGKFDLVAIRDTTAAIVDYKTGRGDVEESRSNYQLRAQAVLVWEKWPSLTRIAVTIIQPWVAGQYTIAEYSVADLAAAQNQIREILAESQKPDAPRIPGEKQCKYCKARATCPEAREAALALPVVNVPANITPDAMAAALTGPTLSEFLDRAKFAKSVIKACEDEAKRRLEEGDEVPGWTLAPGATVAKITNPELVFGRFSELGGSTEAFMGTVTVAKGKLKDAVKGATGAKGKALEAQLETLLAGCTTETQNAASLERVK